MLYELAQYASEPSEQEHLHKMASSSGEGKVSLRTPVSTSRPLHTRCPQAAHPLRPCPPRSCT